MDWSSDVCSSDLARAARLLAAGALLRPGAPRHQRVASAAHGGRARARGAGAAAGRGRTRGALAAAGRPDSGAARPGAAPRRAGRPPASDDVTLILLRAA